VPVPRTMAVETAADVETAIAEIGFPCALKPRHIHEFVRHFRRKLFVATDAAELRAAFAETSAHSLAMIVTEIVGGPEDRFCSMFTYLDADGRPLFLYTKRKLRQYPPRFGVGTYHLTHWDPAVAEMGLRLLRQAGFVGLGNVEFKRDPHDGSLKLIECNARFTAVNELLYLSGYDVGAFVFWRAVGREVRMPERARDGVRMWSPVQDTLALVASRRAGELTTLDWARTLTHRQHLPLFRWSDPAPATVSLYHMAVRARRRWSQRDTPDSREAAGAAVA